MFLRLIAFKTFAFVDKTWDVVFTSSSFHSLSLCLSQLLQAFLWRYDCFTFHGCSLDPRPNVAFDLHHWFLWLVRHDGNSHRVLVLVLNGSHAKVAFQLRSKGIQINSGAPMFHQMRLRMNGCSCQQSRVSIAKIITTRRVSTAWKASNRAHAVGNLKRQYTSRQGYDAIRSSAR